MIQGNQISKEKEPAAKEMGRAQSMKPMAEPLINQKDDSKTLYWRLNSNVNDDQTTMVLDK